MSQTTPMSSYSGPVVVDPLTRIEGHLRIEVEVEKGKVKDVRSCGTLFRGLEMILKGRDPRDVQHFTQRTCGVCTYTHALASTRALEDAIFNASHKDIPANATYIRNLVLGQLFLHDHIVHFYHLHALDWVDVTSALQADPSKAASLANSISSRPTKAEDLRAVQDKLKAFVASGQLGPFTNAYFLGGHPAYYLEPEANLVATAHYLEALRVQVEAARGMAVFGGKNPHPQFLVAGGVTCYDALTPERIKEFEEIYKKTAAFVRDVYIPDLLIGAGAYKDWAGIGGTQDFRTLGDSPTAGGERKLESRWLKPGIIYNRDLAHVQDFDPTKISEHIRHSWYDGDKADNPYDEKTEPKFTHMGDKDRYSWLKAPRYDEHSTETGPLACVLVNYAKGNPDIKPLVDMVLQKLSVGPEALFSTLGRTAARCIETLAIANKMASMLEEFKDNIRSDKQIVEDLEVPQESRGVGFVEAPRGGLSHWIRIEKGRVGNFQLVVPTTWNLGPRDANNVLGPCEEALMGTPIADPKRPVEILRTVHAFDPCIACAVHVIDGETNEVRKFKVL